MKYLKIIFIILLTIFSFYYADKVTNTIIYSSNTMKKIKKIENSYYKEAIDATIDNQFIIPGINGKKIDELSSYYNMKNSKNFNESLLVFEQIEPKISINNNLDKIINKGNTRKSSITFIISNSNIESYCKKNNIPFETKSTKEYCLIDLSTCKTEKYKVKSTYELNNESFLYLTILPGDIIYIKEDLSLNYFKYFIKNINYHNIKIVNINNLLDESS